MNQPTDSQMLDWLQEQAKKSPTGISFDFVNHVEDGHVVERGFRFMRRFFIGEQKRDIREAIRFGMDAEKRDWRDA